MSESAVQFGGATVDESLSLLANERRRVLIRYLVEESDEVVELDDVTQYMTTYEVGPDYSSSERKRLYIAMYQTHLPELVDAGVIKRINGDNAHTYQTTEELRALYDVLTMATRRLGGAADV